MRRAHRRCCHRRTEYDITGGDNTDFLIDNIVTICGIAAALIAALVLFVAGYKNYARRIIYILVCEAEKRFGAGTGKIKFAEVFSSFYAKLPAFLRSLFPEKEISAMIESAVAKMKSALADEQKRS